MKQISNKVLRRLTVFSRHIGQVTKAHLSTSTPQIQVSKPLAMIDEKVKITVDGLGHGQKITLQAYLKEKNKPYGACGHYIADSNGSVDTFRDAAHGGTFTGHEAMGLFWSMKSTPGAKPGRLVKNDTMVPYDITIAVQDGFLNFEDLQWSHDSNCLASCKLQRTYAASGVRRIPVNENGLYGTLFLPPGKGPFPGLIDVFGFTGGIMEFRAALLASHGFASFAIAYVGHEDLPRTDKDLDFTYFLKAFDWLASHSDINSNSLGGVATCVGCGYLQFIASMRPALKCLVTVNGTGVPMGRDQVIEGQLVTPAPFQPERMVVVDGMTSFREMYLEGDVVKICPSWQYGAKHLWIQGLDDQSVNPDVINGFMKNVPPEYLKNITVVKYPGAGHILEPPYSPMCRTNYNALFQRYMIWGGQPEPHAKAQEKSWPIILDFLHTNLG